MEETLVYDGRWPFGGGAAAACAMGVTMVVLAVVGQFLAALFFAAFTIATGWEQLQHCVRIELHPNQDLVLQYFRRRCVTRVAEVRTITRRSGEGGTSFKVEYRDGTFVIGNSRRARDLVDTLLRLNPSIAVHGRYHPST
jgi:hypothetical protein